MALDPMSLPNSTTIQGGVNRGLCRISVFEAVGRRPGLRGEGEAEGSDPPIKAASALFKNPTRRERSDSRYLQPDRWERRSKGGEGLVGTLAEGAGMLCIGVVSRCDGGPRIKGCAAREIKGPQRRARSQLKLVSAGPCRLSSNPMGEIRPFRLRFGNNHTPQDYQRRHTQPRLPLCFKPCSRFVNKYRSRTFLGDRDRS